MSKHSCYLNKIYYIKWIIPHSYLSVIYSRPFNSTESSTPIYLLMNNFHVIYNTFPFPINAQVTKWMKNDGRFSMPIFIAIQTSHFLHYSDKLDRILRQVGANGFVINKPALYINRVQFIHVPLKGSIRDTYHKYPPSLLLFSNLATHVIQ